MQRRSSLVVVGISALLFGTLAILTPLAYEAGAEPLPLLSWRFALSSALLFALVALSPRVTAAASRADLARYAALGLTGYGAASICFFFALTFADAGVVAVLLYTYPAMVTIVQWVSGGSAPRSGQLLAVLVTFAGVVLVLDPFGGSVAASVPGVALGLGAAAGYTAFSVLSHRWLPGRSRLTLMAWTFLFAGVLAVAATTVVSLATGSSPFASLSPAGWEPRVWPLLAAIVLLPTFGAVVLYLEGIRGLGPAQASIVSTLEPIFTILLAWWVLDQPLTPVQIAGAALIIVGVVTAERSARPSVVEEPPVV